MSSDTMMCSKLTKRLRPITLAEFLPEFPLPPAPNPIPASAAPVPATSSSSPSAPPYPDPSSGSSIKQGVFYKVPPVKKVLTLRQREDSSDIPSDECRNLRSDEFSDLPTLEGYIPAVPMPGCEKLKFVLQVGCYFS